MHGAGLLVAAVAVVSSAVTLLVSRATTAASWHKGFPPSPPMRRRTRYCPEGDLARPTRSRKSECVGVISVDDFDAVNVPSGWLSLSPTHDLMPWHERFGHQVLVLCGGYSRLTGFPSLPFLLSHSGPLPSSRYQYRINMLLHILA